MQITKPIGIILAACFITVSLVLLLGYLNNQSAELKLLRHQNIVSTMLMIKPGYSKAKTEEVISKISPDFNPEKINNHQWVVASPYEFGATNWILVIDFENDKVKSLKIRTSDSMNIKPDGAPGDIQDSK